MNKESCIQLTNNLYHLTLLFPKKEPLRYKMRGVADTILANFISFSQEMPFNKNNTVRNLENNLEILDSFFEVVKAQNWVKPIEILNLQKEYSKLREKLKEKRVIKTETKFIQPAQPAVTQAEPAQFFNGERIFKISPRQQKILAVLKEKGRAQVWEIKKIFPEISKRTLRRDFENLFKQGIIERMGEKNNTFYRLKIGQSV